MALYPDYISVANLKTVLGITDSVDDASLGYAVTAASRAIDKYCGRQFGLSGSAVARYYDSGPVFAGEYPIVPIDDVQTTTGLVVKGADALPGSTFDTTLVNGTDFRLVPLNAAVELAPWTALEIVTTPWTRYEVTANYGWTTVPTEVTHAALIQATRFWKRKDAPFGVAGSPELGSEVRLLASVDPDVALILSGLRRPWIV